MSLSSHFQFGSCNLFFTVLLREGRASLQTAYQLFRFMAMYSMIQFSAVVFSYFMGSVLGNWQYLYQDLVIVFPLTILMGVTGSGLKLSNQRPSGSLMSTHNVLTILVHMLICWGFQFWVRVIFFIHHGHF